MKNFLLVEHGGAKKEFTLKTLKERKLNLFLACTKAPDWVYKYIPKDKIVITDTYNSVKLLSDIVTFFESKNLKLDVVGTFQEHTVTQTADLAAAFGLIGLNPAAARRSSTNKLLTRIFCRNAGIPTPKFIAVQNFDKSALENAFKIVGVPCVIKPIFGSESYGTIKIEKDYNIDKIISEIKQNTTDEKKETFKNFTGNLIVEEYLPGLVVSVDGIVQNKKIQILGLVEFEMGPEPRFTQQANYIPARLDKKTKDECRAMAKKVIKTLGFDNCGFHCEQRITPDGPRLLEIAARLPGGPLQPGYKKSFGVDLTSKLIDVWLGKKIMLKGIVKNFVLQKAVFPTNKGVIKKISGLKEAKKITGVWDLTQISHENEEVVTYPNIPKPFYYYAIATKSPASLESLSRKIESTVRIEIG